MKDGKERKEELLSEPMSTAESIRQKVLAVEGEDFLLIVAGGNMEVIIKTPEEAGGPLNQFGTIGVYFETGGGVLYEERLLRVECGSFYSQEDEDDDA